MTWEDLYRQTFPRTEIPNLYAPHMPMYYTNRTVSTVSDEYLYDEFLAYLKDFHRGAILSNRLGVWTLIRRLVVVNEELIRRGL